MNLWQNFIGYIADEENGRKTATFTIQLVSDANTLETVAEVKKILEESEKDFLPDMEYLLFSCKIFA